MNEIRKWRKTYRGQVCQSGDRPVRIGVCGGNEEVDEAAEDEERERIVFARVSRGERLV